ncbi:MAG TPA: tetratricopeptide repeat protein, partial [Candidatus Acidoferrum sp.]|nr:tetratricopeptide repeat protein [Candidatus Acidoferrum sp.]
HLTRATELATDSGAPRFALARALVERGRFDEARPHLDLLLAVNPDHAGAHLELARIHAARNQFKEATHALQLPLANQITRRQAMLLAAQVAQRNSQPDTATQLSRSALALPRGVDWPDPFLKEVQALRTDRARLADAANALMQQQRFAEAEAALTQLMETVPDDAEGLLLLGRLRYLQKNCVAAEAFYRRHLGLQSGSLNGLVQLGIALMCQERWTNAAQVLEQAIALKPDFGSAHHNLGVCRSRTGNSAGAIRAFQDALRCTPGDVNTLFALAEELANANQVPQAIECVKRAEALAPNDPRLATARKQLGVEGK